MQARVDPNSLAIDGNALNGLKRASQQDTPEAIRAAAKQFEGVLMNMMLKSMRDTVPQDGMFENDQSRMFMGMLDQQLSTNLSQKGLGLTDVLVRQLTRVSQPAADANIGTDKTSTEKTNGNSSSLIRQDVSVSMQHAAHPLLSNIADKLRNSYQQWQDGEPSPLLSEHQANVQALTVPAEKIAGFANRIADKTQQFIAHMLPHAQAASASSGIPAQYMVGQAALESGWGHAEIKTANGNTSHNLFGIKADAHWQGKTVDSVTTEYVNGVKQRRVETFRAYDSYADAFKDYAKLISQNPRYQNAMQNTHSASAYAHALQRAGYATDPNYGQKLTQVIQKISG